MKTSIKNMQQRLLTQLPTSADLFTHQKSIPDVETKVDLASFVNCD